jgi:hypothetical protein
VELTDGSRVKEGLVTVAAAAEVAEISPNEGK